MDLIDRQAAIKAIEDLQDCYNGFSDTYDKACIIGVLQEIPTIDTLYGYKIEHLAMIAAVMQKENASPEKVAETITDVDRMLNIIIDEQREMIRKEMGRWLTG